LDLSPFPRIIVALSQELAGYAARLGDDADKLADEDPLVPPARVIQRLRAIVVPTGASALSDARIVRLAAAASQQAAVSSRQELYPQGMDAARALKLSQGALYGVVFLTVEQIRDRVGSRYPEAEPLPDRPTLDELLRVAGFDFQWDPAGKGSGCYVSRLRDTVSITSGSESVSRIPTGTGPHEAEVITPEIADARQFEERLQRGIKDGSFLALLVHPKYYERAARELCHRFPIELVDFEGAFLDALRQVAGQANVNWQLVLKTDTTPNQGDWDKLMLLVGRAMPIVEESLVTGHSSLVTGHLRDESHTTADTGQMTNDKKTILLVYTGLLARYDQMSFLERMRDKVGRRDGIPGLWILLPGQNQALMDGKAVPLLGPGQKANIPESWLHNVHRGS